MGFLLQDLDVAGTFICMRTLLLLFLVFIFIFFFFALVSFIRNSFRVREAAKETLEAVFAENAPAGSLAAPTRCAPGSSRASEARVQ